MKRIYLYTLYITLVIILTESNKTWGQTPNDIITEVRLQEVTVNARKISAKGMIKRAKDLLPVNYPMQTCIYGMQVNHRIENGKQTISEFKGETILTINGYLHKHNCEARLIKHSTFVNNRNLLPFNIPSQSDAFPNILINKLFVSQLDFIKNSGKYTFSYSDEETDERVKVLFRPTKRGKKHYYKGSLVINKHNYAIEKIQYDIDADKDMLADKDGVIEISWRVKVNIYGINYTDAGSTTICFEKRDGKYHVAEMSNSYDYRYVKTEGETTTYHASNELRFNVTGHTDIDKLKTISLHLDNLEEYKRDETDEAEMSEADRKKYERLLNKMKKKYPELEEKMLMTVKQSTE